MDTDFRNQRVTVAGLGNFGGGVAVARWLVQQGARVLVTDREPREKLIGAIEQLSGLPIEYRLGEHRVEDFTSADLVVVNPAIKPSNEFVTAARAAGVRTTTEIGLFIERCPSRNIVGVTGTKGKSTTATLLSLMLSTSQTTWTGGNIGVSLLADLPRIQRDDFVVLELSSYMLEYLGPMRWSPHVAVVNMIAVDHIAWHGSEERYVDAKRNIVRFQTRDDIAVVSDENEASAGFAAFTPAQIVRYGIEHRPAFELALRGRHNQLNAQAAFAAAGALGVSWDEAQRAIRDFAGLPHRMKLVHVSELNVQFIDDSIATIPEAAIAALQSFPAHRVIQIVGGSDKGLPIEEMCAALAKHAKAVLCIGATGPAVEAAMRKVPTATSSVSTPVHACGDLEHAMKMARERATGGDIVLLSPGFASYDQFTNFERRGERFEQLAKLA